jgi:hypothetical protein
VIALCAIVPASGVAAQPAARGSFTSQEREAIRRRILQEGRPSTTTPAGVVPGGRGQDAGRVELFWMPPGAGLNRYRCTVVNRRALVLDYQDRRVIEILEGPPERK